MTPEQFLDLDYSIPADGAALIDAIEEAAQIVWDTYRLHRDEALAVAAYRVYMARRFTYASWSISRPDRALAARCDSALDRQIARAKAWGEGGP